MRVFMVTGEASGDMLAASLATAMREFVPDIQFAGIGGERMASAGIELTTRTTGWASMGPLAALVRIPPLLIVAWRLILWLRSSPWDLIVVVDFGAFNLRLARWLRRIGYRKPILYYFPPAAWLDSPTRARAVVRYSTPLTAFAHQRDFYQSLDLPIAYFGHPLVSLIEPRRVRPAAARDGGIVALLPGSRRGEIVRHLDPLLRAARLIRAQRPLARFVIGAADAEAEELIRETVGPGERESIQIVRGARAALDAADAAWIASGTAVLEAALREVPAVALYIISDASVGYAKRVWLNKHRYVTLPNLLLEREIVPEYLQEAATPEALAAALEALLNDPTQQLGEMRALRGVLGAPDTLRRCAAFAVEVAKSG